MFGDKHDVLKTRTVSGTGGRDLFTSCIWTSKKGNSFSSLTVCLQMCGESNSIARALSRISKHDVCAQHGVDAGDGERMS